ncbi:unnamed protein product [Owenia fusiformis]|uniref:Uncharacterized protein n=1 Tax=Owenia fusiformis TaxID=6347 RepID=A0A8J1TCR8_OWEFU|nr:unnamed protein product [Owenia fusiformis]
MGNTLRYVARPFRNWNIENRAIKQVEKTEKGTTKKPAPKHQTTEALLKNLQSSSPEFLEEQMRQDSDLLERLKQVKVESTGENPELKAKPRPLPENRTFVDDPEFGYLEPAIVPKGKTTIQKALVFISQHQEDPETHTASKIAEEQQLDIAEVERVLKYFQTYHLFTPPAKGEPPQTILDKIKRKGISAGIKNPAPSS